MKENLYYFAFLTIKSDEHLSPVFLLHRVTGKVFPRLVFTLVAFGDVTLHTGPTSAQYNISSEESISNFIFPEQMGTKAQSLMYHSFAQIYKNNFLSQVSLVSFALGC